MDVGVVKDLAGLSRPLTKLVGVVAAGCGRMYEPIHTRLMAGANAHADRVKTQSAIDVAALGVRAQERDESRRLRRQRNIESIVGKAAKYLPDEVSAAPVDDDWAFDFFEEAQDTSGDELQELWAKLLATEVAQPGMCSRRTLKIVRTMSKGDAEAFTCLASCIFETRSLHFVIPTSFWAVPDFGVNHTAALELESLGLISISNSSYMGVPSRGWITYFGSTFAIEGSKANARLPYLHITARGAELRRVVDAKPNENYIAAVARRLCDECQIYLACATGFKVSESELNVTVTRIG